MQMGKSLLRAAGEDQAGAYAVVGPGKARVELDGDLELRDGEIVLAPQVVHASECAVGGRVVARQLHATPRRYQRLLAIFFR